MACRPGASTSHNALMRDHCTVAVVAVREGSSKTQSEVEIYLKQNMLVYLTYYGFMPFNCHFEQTFLWFHCDFFGILFSLKYLFTTTFSRELKNLITFYGLVRLFAWYRSAIELVIEITSGT